MKKQRQLRLLSSINLLLLTALFGLCAWVSTLYHFDADLTRTGRHTISEASAQILSRATEPLFISAYAREDSELRSVIKKFVGKFQKVKPDITLQFINPDTAPDEVRQLGINVNGELLVRYEGRSEHVRTDSEQEFVNALQRLLRGSERWLAFLDGHGERRSAGQANHDLGEWVAQLKYRGFKFRPLNLSETGTVPDNTSVLVIASPLVRLLPGELDIIEAYIEKGGNMLWLVDPGDESGMDRIADMLNIKVADGVVIDTAAQLLGINDPTIALTTARLYPQHAVTRDFGLTVFFPKATAVTALPGSSWVSKPVLVSGNHTWLELGKLSGDVAFDPEQEQQGPLSLGLSLERELQESGDNSKEQRQQRIMVIGDGDFLSNTYVGNNGNLELGVRIINWLSSDDSLITLPVRTVEDSHLNLSQLTLGGLALILLLLLPLSFLLAGFTIWWRRKKL